MGRNAAITYEQVAAAADQLQSEGQPPTAKLVRTRIGVGSLGTLQKHIVEWRTRQGGTNVAARLLPPEVQRAIFKFLEEEICRINGELRQQVEQAEHASADLAADNEEQAILVSQLRAELAEQASLRDKQDGQLSRLLDELKDAREEAANERREAELARHELTRLQSRFEAQVSLEREHRELRAELQAEREVRVHAERDAAVLKAQKDILEARIAELKETASVQARIRGLGEEEHADKQLDHAPRASAGASKRAGGSSDPSPDPVSVPGTSSITSAMEEQSDSRQAKLC